MKIAVLLQGDPRFCSEFDQFLTNLTGYSQVDWFMYLWKDNAPSANLLSSQGHKIVSPAWQTVDKQWALDKFKKFLPQGHQVVALELGEQQLVPVVDIKSNICQTVIIENVWKMWYSQFMANKLKTQHEQQHNFKYDLVIKTRPDLALLDTLDVQHVKHYFDTNPNLVLMSSNKHCGYGVNITDTNAVTTSDNMNIYADIFNQALYHHEQGCIFHPETLLARHLMHNGLRYSPSSHRVDFRSLGTWTDLTTGETWCSNSVPLWHNKYYTSDFGRWS
jgi:hypothetical protein